MACFKRYSSTRFLTLIGLSVATLGMASGCLVIPTEDDDAFCDDFDGVQTSNAEKC